MFRSTSPTSPGAQARAGPTIVSGFTQAGSLTSGSNSAGQGLRDKKAGARQALANADFGAV